ncbi:MAG: hypothetical protein BGO30_03435 [Bacteroidetes bacterium 41-46]|nr:MAG: hypothetical protein BGO30_03435 [Bacteroidetes bacterium 41-46]
MKVLTLSIKQQWFDEIRAGKKTIETREIKPTTASKYIEYSYNGERIKESQITDDMEGVEAIPIKYDAIKFLTGAYEGTRPSMIVEVTGEEVYILTDEETGEDLVYENNGVEYVAAEIVYSLGKIIE